MDVVQQSAVVPSFANKRTNEWILSQEAEDDISIRAGDLTFTVQKFGLVSKCGYMRKRLAESEKLEQGLYEIPDVPGAAEGFELAVKFCYAMDMEIDIENVALLRCVAEFLEMTDDYAIGNLVNRTEGYLTDVALRSLQGSITVLHHSEGLLPIAEKVKLVSRCIDAIAHIASSSSSCNDDFQFCSRKDTDDRVRSSRSTTSPLASASLLQPKGFADWWAEDLTVLRIDTFKRLILAMKASGFKPAALGTLLMLYAQKSLRGLDIFGRGRKKMDPKKEHEKRVVLETIVSILPKERNVMSVSFHTLLLRAAVYLETTLACRLDLERRIGLQLGQAVLDDLLIPSSYSFSGDTVFDVDSVRRILTNHIQHHEEAMNMMGYNSDDDHCALLPSPTDMERVGRLMECYIAEIASDRNLTVPKFVGLAELIPEQAKITEDGMYRAIDIYLKAHPSLNDAERKKVCGVMDCQRLSREACAHAAQNERLPVQIVVQVLYYEQQRLCDAMNGGGGGGGESPFPPSKIRLPSPNNLNAPPDHELVSLRRENDNLKHELAKMKTRMKQIGKNTTGQGFAAAAAASPEKPPVLMKSIIDSVSKKLGRFNPFLHFDSIKSPTSKVRSKPPRDRRHSVS